MIRESASQPHVEGRLVRQALGIALFVILCGAIAAPSWPRAPRFSRDFHLWLSVAQAVNLSLCKQPLITPGFEFGEIGRELFETPSLVEQPLQQWVVRSRGDAVSYCAAQTVPRLNNENTLMWVLRAGLFVKPDASMLWLGGWLYAIKLLLVLSFAVTYLRLGLGWWSGIAVFAIAVEVLRVLSDTHFYSVYTLMMPGVLGILAVWGWLWSRADSRRWPTHLLWMISAGIMAAAVANVRTSYAPILLALAGLWCVGVSSRRPDCLKPARRALFLAGSAAAFLTGIGLFWFMAVRPLIVMAPGWNYSHHVISHPLVLSLALPKSALSEREGIAWDDGLGLAIARKVDPQAQYLGAGYAEALTAYYLGLWRANSNEMLGIYVAKAKLAGSDAIDRVTKSNAVGLVPVALVPFSFVADGRWLLFGFSALALASAWRLWHTASTAWLGLGGCSVVLILLQLESSVIVPYFYWNLHSTYVTVLAVLGVAVWREVFDRLRVSILRKPARIQALWLGAAIVLVDGAVQQFSERMGFPPAIDNAVVIALLGVVGIAALRAIGGARWGMVSTVILFVAIGLSGVAALAEKAERDRGPALFGSQPPVSALIRHNILLEAGSWPYRAESLGFQSSGVATVSGKAEGPYSYLLVSPPTDLLGQTHIVAEGIIVDGAVTLGLQQENRWVSQVNVDRPGPFRVSILVPADGKFQIVLANSLPQGQAINELTVHRLGNAR